MQNLAIAMKIYLGKYPKTLCINLGKCPKNSTAEIDYLIEINGEILPVEIKSGSTGRMKSLHMFIEKHKTQKALKISQAPFADGKPIISLPFYAIESFFKSIL